MNKVEDFVNWSVGWKNRTTVKFVILGKREKQYGTKLHNSQWSNTAQMEEPHNSNYPCWLYVKCLHYVAEIPHNMC